jgi:hypothetical protein
MTVVELITPEPPGVRTEDLTANEPSSVLDEASFFQTSQLVDALRDTAISFLEFPPTAGSPVLSEMVEHYNDLRERTLTLVTDAVAEQTNLFTTALDGDVDVHTVVFASTQLARWIDSVHVLPTYLLGQELQAASANEARTKLDSLGESGPESAAGPAGTGNYL